MDFSQSASRALSSDFSIPLFPCLAYYLNPQGAILVDLQWLSAFFGFCTTSVRK